MAAELIENPGIPHTLEHDLESVFWVLLWVTLLYMKTSWPMVSTTLNDAMNPRVYPSGGGASKLHFIGNPSALAGLFPQQSPKMHHLLTGIHAIFCERYHKRIQQRYLKQENEIYHSARKNADFGTDKSADEAGIATQSGNEVSPSLEALYTTVLKVFEDVLKDESFWSTTDRAERQLIEMPYEMKSAAQSGSKRSKERLEEHFGITLPPSKRSGS
jgi:Fungal protein kinase